MIPVKTYNKRLAYYHKKVSLSMLTFYTGEHWKTHLPENAIYVDPTWGATSDLRTFLVMRIREESLPKPISVYLHERYLMRLLQTLQKLIQGLYLPEMYFTKNGHLVLNTMLAEQYKQRNLITNTLFEWEYGVILDETPKSDGEVINNTEYEGVVLRVNRNLAIVEFTIEELEYLDFVLHQINFSAECNHAVQVFLQLLQLNPNDPTVAASLKPPASLYDKNSKF